MHNFGQKNTSADVLIDNPISIYPHMLQTWSVDDQLGPSIHICTLYIRSDKQDASDSSSSKEGLAG